MSMKYEMGKILLKGQILGGKELHVPNLKTLSLMLSSE